MATKNKKNIHFNVKDKNGKDYLCPLDAVEDKDAITDQELDECVEEDVVGRYAGNIDVESH